VTFDSPTEGFVLATTACARPPCTTIERTRDGGRTWAAVRASTMPVNGVKRIRFGSSHDGWLFGPSLYATHDGGGTWRAVTMPGPVLALEAAGGRVFAVVGSCPSGTQGCQPDDVHLWRADQTGDHWTEVPGVAGRSAAADPSPLVLHGHAGWLLLGDALFSTTDGSTWSRTPSPCPPDTSMASVAAPGTAVGFLCIDGAAAGSTEKTLVVSTDGGRTTRVAGAPPRGGSSSSLAGLTTQTWIVASSSGASWFYRSTDGGRTWPGVTTYTDGGAGFTEFGFTTASQGVAIHRIDEASSELLMSRNGGITWSTIKL